jgi:hypothetical protein
MRRHRVTVTRPKARQYNPLATDWLFSAEIHFDLLKETLGKCPVPPDISRDIKAS